MELTRAERQIYYASDSGNKNWSTFFKKPGSESDCLSGKLRRIFEISNSVAGLKVEKMGGVAVQIMALLDY